MPACALRAVWLDLRRGWVVASPAKHGLPHDRRGYAMVARRALKVIGVKPENPVMRAGATYDAQKYRNAVRNVMADLKPVSCAVMPQAVGTPLSCGKKSGTVINIGHGTTGIVNAHGRSAPAASQYQGHQLSYLRRCFPGNSKSACVDHGGLFARSAAVTGKPVHPATRIAN